MKHPPLLFLDVEALGLGEAPVWEVAAARIDFGWKMQHWEAFVQHDPHDMDPNLPQAFRDDYLARYAPTQAVPTSYVSERIGRMAEGGAIVCGSNPDFDMTRIAAMNPAEKMPWHYHPMDIPTLVHGYLLGKGISPAPPWKSDLLSQMVGVSPKDFDRHSAMGDVMWTLAMWKAVTS